MFTILGRKWRKAETKLADVITRFAGSMFFVYIHVVWFALWLLYAAQIGDPFPFGLLTMVVSLEAIFLVTFIMVAQNRQAEMAEQRAAEEEQDEEEFQEEIEEEFDDIQEDFDSLKKDLDEMKKLITRLEGSLSQKAHTPPKPPKE